MLLPCGEGNLCMYHTKSHQTSSTRMEQNQKSVKETILFMFHNPRLELRIIGKQKFFFVHVKVIE